MDVAADGALGFLESPRAPHASRGIAIGATLDFRKGTGTSHLKSM
jgi:hypothetical protein